MGIMNQRTLDLHKMDASVALQEFVHSYNRISDENQNPRAALITDLEINHGHNYGTTIRDMIRRYCDKQGVKYTRGEDRPERNKGTTIVSLREVEWLRPPGPHDHILYKEEENSNPPLVTTSLQGVRGLAGPNEIVSVKKKSPPVSTRKTPLSLKEELTEFCRVPRKKKDILGFKKGVRWSELKGILDELVLEGTLQQGKAKNGTMTYGSAGQS